MIKRFTLAVATLATVLVLGGAPAYAAGGTSCGGTKTEFIGCEGKQGVGAIGDLVRIALMIMTIGVGVVAVGGIAYASIIYASAHDEQSKVAEARTIIRNIVIGLILYGMTIAIIAWLLPGDVVDTSSSASPSPSTMTNLP